MKKIFYIIVFLVFILSSTSINFACELPSFKAETLSMLRLKKSDLPMISDIICKQTSEKFVSVTDGTTKRLRKNSAGKIEAVVIYSGADIIVLTGKLREKGTRFALKKKDGEWILLRKSTIFF